MCIRDRAIVKGENVPRPGVPESFRVLIKELQSLALDVRVLDEDKNEIDLKQNFDDDVGFDPSSLPLGDDVLIESELNNYTIGDVENSDAPVEEENEDGDDFFESEDLLSELDADFAEDESNE